ncbi:MAG: VOC family protein [Chitinophagaceae bacterium]
MNPKKIWSNLAVSNLERTTKFYTELGFKSNGSSKELTSFLVGKDNFVMHFFLNDKLKTALKGDLADLQHGNEILFTPAAEAKSKLTIGRKRLATQEKNHFQTRRIRGRILWFCFCRPGWTQV